jgi:hypothetical protein
MTRSAAQRLTGGAEQFKTAVLEHQRSRGTGATDLSGSGARRGGQGGIIEAADRRAYNCAHGLASRFSAPAETTQELNQVRARPDSLRPFWDA